MSNYASKFGLARDKHNPCANFNARNFLCTEKWKFFRQLLLLMNFLWITQLGEIFSVWLLLIRIHFASSVKVLSALVCNSWIILHLTSAFSTFSTSLFSRDLPPILFLSRNFDKKHKWIRRFVRETGRIHTRIFATLICFPLICFSA